MTELLFLRDATSTEFTATVTALDDRAVVLDRTLFYPTGGGQPHDTGRLLWPDGDDLAEAVITDVRKDGTAVWHQVDGAAPSVGTVVTGEIDWQRRHALMRTHTAMHLLCGVIWNEYHVSVTGGNMEPLKGRMDFAFDPLPDGFADTITELVNAEIAADRPVEVTFLARETAVEDEDLIRTAVNLIPETVTEIRVVDIVGLDRQADGGTHVARTGEVGTFAVTKTESKGRGNKRIRFELS